MESLLSNSFATSLHITGHVFHIPASFMHSSSASLPDAVAASFSRLRLSYLSLSHLNPSTFLVIDAETYWFSSRLLLAGHLAVSFTCAESTARGFFRSVKEDQLHSLLDFNFQNFSFIHRVQLTLKLFHKFQTRGFSRICCEVLHWHPCWGTSRTGSLLNDRTLWK